MTNNRHLAFIGWILGMCILLGSSLSLAGETRQCQGRITYHNVTDRTLIVEGVTYHYTAHSFMMSGSGKTGLTSLKKGMFIRCDYQVEGENKIILSVLPVPDERLP